MMLTLSLHGTQANDLPAALGLIDNLAPSMPFPWGKARFFELSKSDSHCTIALLIETNILLQQIARAQTPAIGTYVHAGNDLASVLFTQAIDGFWKVFQQTTLPELTGEFHLELPTISLEDSTEQAREWFQNAGFEIEMKGKAPIFNLYLKRDCSLIELLKTVAILIPALDSKSKNWWEAANANQFATFAQSQIADHPNLAEILAGIRKTESTSKAKFRAFYEDDSKYHLELQNQDNSESLSETWKQIINALKETNSKKLLSIGIPSAFDCIELVQQNLLEEFAITELAISDLQAFIHRLNRYQLPANAGEVLKLFPSAPILRYENFQNYDAIVVPKIQNWIRKFQLPAFEESIFESAKPALLIISGQDNSLSKLDDTIQWNFAQAKTWANSVATKYGYILAFDRLNSGQKSENEWLAIFHFITLR